MNIPYVTAMNIDAIQTWIMQTVLFQNEYAWMMQVLGILLATALVSFVATLLLHFLHKTSQKSITEWDDIAIEAARKPIKLAIWVIGISIAGDLLLHRSESPLFENLGALREVVVVFAIAWGLIRFINKGTMHYVALRKNKGESVDLTTVQAISKLLKITLIITTILITLQNMGISISGLLAFGGVGGIAIGFAAQDLLANFFGALIIYFDKPFKVGDWIRSPDQEIEGTVKEISWRMTTIETFDKRPLYVPNSAFTKISVQNPSRMTHRRIKETIGIRYDDIGVMQAVTDDVREMLKTHDEIDETQTLLVYFNAFNESSCDFFVYTFTRTTDWQKYHEVKHDVLLKIAAIIAEHNAEMAYPTRVEYTIETPIKQ